MKRVLEIVNRYGSLVSFLVAMAAFASVIIGAYNVKVIADNAIKETEENRKLIDEHYSEYKKFIEKNDVSELRVELKNTGELLKELNTNLNDLEREFIKRGINGSGN